MPEMEKSHLLYGLIQVENIAGHKWEEEKDRARERERGKRLRDSVWLRKGCFVSHKFDRWSNSAERRDN